jgi:hypothetical protein
MFRKTINITAWSLLLCAGLFFSTPLMAAKVMDGKAQTRHDSAVVRVHTTNVPCRGGRLCRGHGTGFLINRQGYVITNHHVIAGVIGHEHDGFIPDGSFYNRKRFHIVWADRRLDLAILKVEGLKRSRIPLKLAYVEGSHKLIKGSKLWTSGYPGVSDIFGKRLEPVRKGGELSAYTRIKGGVRVIEHDAATNPGNSGGPVSDLCGRVIAVTSIGIKPGKGVGTYWSIRISEAIDQLRRRNIPFTLDRSKCVVAVAGKPTVIKRTTVIRKIIKGQKGQKGDKGKDAPLWILVALGVGVGLVLLLVLFLWLKVRKRPAGEGMTEYVRREMSRLVKRQPDVIRQKAGAVGGSTTTAQGGAATGGKVGHLVGRNRLNGVSADLHGEPMVIGRGQQADIRVSDQGIGRQHARIGYDVQTGMFWLEDMGSVNGTWLEDGTQVVAGTRVNLKPGDGFYLGNADYSFRVLV